MNPEIDIELLLKHIAKSDLMGREKLFLMGLVQRSEWIPCSEIMPGKYTAVLVIDNEGDMWFGQVDKNGNWCDADDYHFIIPEWMIKVTHWMPLPEPPEMEEENETD